MGYGSTIIIIMLFVNIFIYVGALALEETTGEEYSLTNAPLINILVAVSSGDAGIMAELIPSAVAWVEGSGVIMGLIIIGIVAMAYVTGGTPILGGGGAGASQVPMLIGVFIFTTLALVPDFGAMGFPTPIDTFMYAVFGLMVAVGVYGVIRGE